MSLIEIWLDPKKQRHCGGSCHTCGNYKWKKCTAGHIARPGNTVMCDDYYDYYEGKQEFFPPGGP